MDYHERQTINFGEINREGGEGVCFTILQILQDEDAGIYTWKCPGVFGEYAEAEEYIKEKLGLQLNEKSWAHTADEKNYYHIERVKLLGSIKDVRYALLDNFADGRAPWISHVSSSADELKNLVITGEGTGHTWMDDTPEEFEAYVYEEGGFTAGAILRTQYQGKPLD